MADDPYALGGVDIEDEHPGDNRPSIYTEGDNVVYRASSLGNCLRELVGIRFGIIPAPWPANFRKAFAHGHRGEDVILDQLRARGFAITRQQEEINWQILPGVILRGHIDCVAQYLGGPPRICDAKTTSKKWGISDHLKKKYDLQLSVYAHALGLSAAMIAIGEKNEVTGDVEGDVVVEDIDDLPFSVSQIKARIAKIESLAKKMRTDADLPSCDTTQRFPCGLYRYHDDEKPVTVRSDAGSDEMFDGLADEYDQARQEEAEAKARKEDAKNRLIAYVGGKVDKETNGWRLSFTGTGIAEQLDKKALAKFLAAHEKTIEEFMGTVSKEKSISVKRVDA